MNVPQRVPLMILMQYSDHILNIVIRYTVIINPNRTEVIRTSSSSVLMSHLRSFRRMGNIKEIYSIYKCKTKFFFVRKSSPVLFYISNCYYVLQLGVASYLAHLVTRFTGYFSCSHTFILLSYNTITESINKNFGYHKNRIFGKPISWFGSRCFDNCFETIIPSFFIKGA